MTSAASLDPVHIAGDPATIGRRLGELARPVMDAYLAQSDAWRAVERWRGHPFVAALRAATARHFPALLDELDGIAAGLGRSADDVFLWNCRGELAHSTPDGCTTLAAVSPRGAWIAHNEDGDPCLRGRCMLVDVQPEGKPGFVSFYYPGSLPGHTFAANRAGLAQAINNVRLLEPRVGVPRMVLARAVLDAASLDDALAVLSDTPRASGFHHTLGAVEESGEADGTARIVSVEATARRCSIEAVGALRGHANHLIHTGHESEAQIVTDSSRDRQLRLAQLLPGAEREGNADALVAALHDVAPSGLPIYRDDPHDPDGENTLATALMQPRADGVALRVVQHHVTTFDQLIARTC